MFLGATGLRSHIWNNNLKSVLLLAGFPVLLILLGLAVTWLTVGLADPSAGSYAGKGARPDLIGAELARLPSIAAWSLGLAGIWFVIAWFFHQSIINAATGARRVSRKEETRVWNLLENLCISRGLTMPHLAVIETPALNAYASGLREGQYTVTVTRGLVDRLDDAELEAVLAHELSHIRHKDVRLLVIAIIFVGIISFVAEIVFRRIFWFGLRSGGDRRSGGRSGGLVIVAALAILAIAYLLAIVIRFSLSRRREYMADAGAVELTRNPDAMIAALNKISGHAEIETAPDEVREMFIENPKTGFMGLFATHPPIPKRIEMLVTYAGGTPSLGRSSVPEI
ncbi:MAG: protease [Oceanicaulis sp.]|uniref:Protease HtpX n=1 Tax=Maricaulis virginensis TaxID=144022 RepID=A0A9W6IP76_9PROT|nr:M48 family metallopeptidase [Maricaulis virginensis]MBI75187.1 protease [Oceanicaulis sp.]GLK53972.1 protease HtpX [Maricaulis virginensis]